MSCLNEKGVPVDWFIVYKIPKIENSVDKRLSSGFAYTFITENSIKSSNDWIFSTLTIDDKDSIFGKTISQVIDNKKGSDVSYVAYNDQRPGSKTSAASKAHAKGLFAVNSDGGFWLSHSVPSFASLGRSYSYPESGERNGQTAICVSLDFNDGTTLQSIAQNFLIMRPNIYDIKIEDNLIDKSELFDDVLNEKWPKKNISVTNNIKSRAGQEFQTFSKSKSFADDLYSHLIASTLKRDLFVQTWRNGAGGKLQSDCKDKYQVQNVQKIIISELKHVDWDYTEDHSKWAITTDTSGQSYTCIADINRVKSQFKRGGGSICLASKQVWKIFKQSVEETEGCPKDTGARNPKG